MNFGPRDYVPVLKVKRGEKKALQSLSPSIQARVMPLLEIVERKPDRSPTVQEHLDNAFKQLAASVRPYSRCFLDAREISPDGPPAAAEVFERASAAGIAFTPVTGVSRSSDVAAALDHRIHGVALRLSRDEFEAGGLDALLRGFMTVHGLDPEEVDLILDLGAVADLVAAGVSALTEAFMAEVPTHTRWRTLTVSACAFPLSMGGVNRRSYALVDRADWNAWRDGLHTRRREVLRLPTFSDCAIQHPAGVEGFDPRVMQVSAAVRYTLPEAWLLIKGVGTRVIPPSVQFPNLATQLVYGHLKPSFAGESHCSGCKLMKAAADGASKLGSAEVWRRLGTIHHITSVVQGLESLPLP